jgi:hypothetical protein
VKKLFGRRDLEDALKRLDKLTHEEARMATAEILKATRTVDGRVAGVDARVANVDDRVADVDNRVRAIDDKVAVAIHGAPTMQPITENNDLELLRRKRSKGTPATNSQQRRPSQTFVFFSFHQCRVLTSRPFRESIAGMCS